MFNSIQGNDSITIHSRLALPAICLCVIFHWQLVVVTFVVRMQHEVNKKKKNKCDVFVS
jgi:hypothetical protein